MKSMARGAAEVLWGRLRSMVSGSYSFQGKTVLISGSSRGLGLAIARELAKEGARLVITARHEEQLQRAYDDLSARGAEVFAMPCDISERQQAEELVAAARAHFGQIDVLIHNAARMDAGPIDVMTSEDFERAMKTNFFGAVHLTEAVLPAMRRRGEGRIIHISSIGGILSLPHTAPYAASKFALTGYSQGLRCELAKDGIVVTTVCPGLMRVGANYNAHFKGRHREEHMLFALMAGNPLTSMSAVRAARRIVLAARRGEAFVVFPLQAKLLAIAHGLFPGLSADIMGLVNRLLPRAGGIRQRRKHGRESTSAYVPSVLTMLADRAALELNELDELPKPYRRRARPRRAEEEAATER